MPWSFWCNGLYFHTVHIFILILFLQDSSFFFFFWWVCIVFVFTSIACKWWSFTYLSDSVPPCFIFILFKQRGFTSPVSFYWIFLYWSFQSNNFPLPYHFGMYHVHFCIEDVIVIVHCFSSHCSISTAKSILKSWFQHCHWLLRSTILEPSDDFGQCLLQL